MDNELVENTIAGLSERIEYARAAIIGGDQVPRGCPCDSCREGRPQRDAIARVAHLEALKQEIIALELAKPKRKPPAGPPEGTVYVKRNERMETLTPKAKQEARREYLANKPPVVITGPTTPATEPVKPRLRKNRNG